MNTTFGNSTSITSMKSPNNFQKALISISMLIALCGILAYVLYVYVVFKHRNIFNNSYYTLTLSLIVPDFVHDATALAYTLPINLGLLNEKVFWSWLPLPIGFAKAASWYAFIIHVAVIATGRFVAVQFYTKYAELFHKNRMRIVVAFCYCTALLIPTMMYSCGCRHSFVSNTWMMICEKATCGEAPFTLDMIIGSYGTISYVAVLNILIIVLNRRVLARLKLSQQNGGSAIDNRIASERTLIIQCLGVSTILLAYTTTYWIVDYMVNNDWFEDKTGTYASNLFGVVNFSMNPFVYFAFSSEIRGKILAIGWVKTVWSKLRPVSNSVQPLNLS